MDKPKIEVKSLKVNTRLSEETLCYSAIIVVDGVKAIDASNRGHGGMDDFWPAKPYGRPPNSKEHAQFEKAMDTLKAYADSLPDIVSKQPGSDFRYRPTVETVIGEAIGDEQVRQMAKRAMARKTLYIEVAELNGKAGVFQVNQKYTPEMGEALMKRIPKGVILNAVPFERAVEIYRNGVVK